MNKTLTALTFATLVIGVVGCGNNSVVGKTFETSGHDTITFQDGGKAKEMNGQLGVLYPGQAEAFDSNQNPLPTSCTYTQDGKKITLACEGDASGKSTYTISDDGSLNGPPKGIYGDKSFAHLTEKK